MKQVNFQSFIAMVFLFFSLIQAGFIHSQVTKNGSVKPVVAVVFSGGGALGLSHIGVLKIIEEMGIPIDIVVGTSMGSIVGGLYTAGYSPQEMEDILTNLDWFETFSDHNLSPADNYEKTKRNHYQIRLSFDNEGFYAGAGLLDGQNIILLFEQLTLHTMGIKDFDQYPVRYRAVAADIINGDEVVLSNGNMADSMRASMSIPALFKPYYLNGRNLADGGLVNNMPVDIARKMGADIVIAIELAGNLIKDPKDFKTPFDATGQTVSLLIAENVKRMRPLADLVIVPDLTNLGPADFTKSGEFIKRGMEAGDKARDQLKALAERIKKSRDLVKPGEQKNRTAKLITIPVLKEIKVEGGDKKDELFIMNTFNSGLNKSPDQQWLKSSVSKVYASDLYDQVRFDMEPRPEGGLTGIVHVFPDKTPDNKIFLGMKYHSDALRANPGSMVLTTGLALEDLTGKNSILYTELSFVQAQRIYLEYFQPIGSLFFIMPYFHYMNEYETFNWTEEIEFNVLYRSIAEGVWAGMNIGRDLEVKTGYSYETVHSLGELTNYENASIIHAAISYDSRPTTVFPFSGFYTLFDIQHANPGYNIMANFWKISSDTELIIPTFNGLSFGLTLSLGTDLSGILTDTDPLMFYRQFNLNGPFQFAGYEDWDIYGSHKAAAGIDAYYKILPISSLIGGDLILLFNFSIGNCIPEYTTYESFYPLHWNLTTGLGLHINNNFGMALRVTCIEISNYAVSIDVGSFD